jgi:hypothetical protein
VTDLLGRLVSRQSIANGNGNAKIEGIKNNGVYIVQLLQDGKALVVEKLIVQ